MLNTEHFGYLVEGGVPDVNNNINQSTVENISNMLDGTFNPSTLDRNYVFHEDFINFLDNGVLNFDEIFMGTIKFNLLTPQFCQDLIEHANMINKWSKGGDQDTYFDNRINAVELYPTKDVHMKDLNLRLMWQDIIKNYVAKVVSHIFNYATKDINIAFIVKYSPDGQDKLSAHHDASAWTLNVCLNNDFVGGGCRFVRNDVTIVNKDIGSALIHPGRITHEHEGLPISSGIRYISVTFVN